MGGTVQSQPLHERVDADAVCVQCNTVNPEGTFICKVCGNNLRDQRHTRLTAEAILEGEAGSQDRNRYLVSGLLTVLGIVLVLGVALNVERVAEWMVGGNAMTTSVERFWNGPQAEGFRALALELADAPLPTELPAAALPGATRDGVYVLVMTNPVLNSQEFIGRAIAREDETGVSFVAQLENGVELRGHAQYYGNSIGANLDEAAAVVSGQTTAASGVAIEQSPGLFEIYGQTESAQAAEGEAPADAGFRATAIRVQ